MSGSTRMSRYQKGKTKKVKTNLDLLEQEIVSGSGIWAICKSAPHPRQPRQHPTTQFFTGRMPFLTPNQQRRSTKGKFTYHTYILVLCEMCIYMWTKVAVCHQHNYCHLGRCRRMLRIARRSSSTTLKRTRAACDSTVPHLTWWWRSTDVAAGTARRSATGELTMLRSVLALGSKSNLTLSDLVSTDIISSALWLLTGIQPVKTEWWWGTGVARCKLLWTDPVCVVVTNHSAPSSDEMRSVETRSDDVRLDLRSEQSFSIVWLQCLLPANWTGDFF